MSLVNDIAVGMATSFFGGILANKVVSPEKLGEVSDVHTEAVPRKRISNVWGDLLDHDIDVVIGTVPRRTIKLTAQVSADEATALWSVLLIHYLYNTSADRKILPCQIKSDLSEARSRILIGGPGRNKKTKYYIDRYNTGIRFEFIDGNSSVVVNEEEFFQVEFGDPIKRQRNMREINRDYGVMLFGVYDERNVAILAGCHAFGTLAATLATGYSKIIEDLADKFSDHSNSNRLAIVSCDISYGSGDWPSIESIQLERAYGWHRDRWDEL